LLSDRKTDLRKSLKSLYDDLRDAENGPDRNTYGFKHRLEVIHENLQDLEPRLLAEFPNLGDFGALGDFEPTYSRRGDSGMAQELKTQIKRLAIEINADLEQDYTTTETTLTKKLEKRNDENPIESLAKHNWTGDQKIGIAEDLKNKYKNFQSLENKRKNRRNLGNVLVMLGTFLPLSILVIIENPEQWIYGAVGIMLTMMITGTIIEGKNKKEILSTQQKAFYNFYNVYDSLRKYCDIPDDKRTMKITLSILNRFSNYIYGWAGKESPKEISELPKSIYKNTREKIIPLIQQKKINEIQSLMKELYELLVFIYDKEPTKEKLKNFNEFVEKSFPKVDLIKEISRYKTLVEKYPIIKFVWIPPAVGAAVGGVLYNIDSTKIFEAVAYSITSGVAILVAVITVSRRK